MKCYVLLPFVLICNFQIQGLNKFFFYHLKTKPTSLKMKEFNMTNHFYKFRTEKALNKKDNQHYINKTEYDKVYSNLRKINDLN